MTIKCEVKEGIAKSGEKYIYLEVSIGNYKKKVFLDNAEKELLRLYANPQK